MDNTQGRTPSASSMVSPPGGPAFGSPNGNQGGTKGESPSAPPPGDLGSESFAGDEKIEQLNVQYRQHLLLPRSLLFEMNLSLARILQWYKYLDKSKQEYLLAFELINKLSGKFKIDCNLISEAGYNLLNAIKNTNVQRRIVEDNILNSRTETGFDIDLLEKSKINNIENVFTSFLKKSDLENNKFSEVLKGFMTSENFIPRARDIKLIFSMKNEKVPFELKKLCLKRYLSKKENRSKKRINNILHTYRLDINNGIGQEEYYNKQNIKDLIDGVIDKGAYFLLRDEKITGEGGPPVFREAASIKKEEYYTSQDNEEVYKGISGNLDRGYLDSEFIHVLSFIRRCTEEEKAAIKSKMIRLIENVDFQLSQHSLVVMFGSGIFNDDDKEKLLKKYITTEDIFSSYGRSCLDLTKSKESVVKKIKDSIGEDEFKRFNKLINDEFEGVVKKVEENPAALLNGRYKIKPHMIGSVIQNAESPGKRIEIYEKYIESLEVRELCTFLSNSTTESMVSFVEKEGRYNLIEMIDRILWIASSEGGCQYNPNVKPFGVVLEKVKNVDCDEINYQFMMFTMNLESNVLDEKGKRGILLKYLDSKDFKKQLDSMIGVLTGCDKRAIYIFFDAITGRRNKDPLKGEFLSLVFNKAPKSARAAFERYEFENKRQGGNARRF